MTRTLICFVLSLLSILVSGNASVSWVQLTPELNELMVTAQRTPIILASDAPLILASGVPADIVGLSGTSTVFFWTNQGPVQISVAPQGDVSLQLVNASGLQPFVAGTRLVWDEPITVLYYPALHMLPHDLVLPIVPAVASDLMQLGGLAVKFAMDDCDAVSMQFTGNQWSWTDTSFSTHVLRFGARIPVEYRPSSVVRVGVTLNIPAWSCLCTLVVRPCGSARIICDSPMTSPVTLEGDQTVSWNL